MTARTLPFPPQAAARVAAATRKRPTNYRAQAFCGAGRDSIFPQASPPFPPVTAEAPFTPFLLGYIELVGEVRVQARLYYPAGQTPQIGQSMQLVFEPLYRTEDGEQIIGYGFAPQEKQ